MDFRLIHIVEPDTSAASHRPGRYEAYTLDFSTFMEPRRRGIEVVEFWEMDEEHRRVGLREAPVYSLDRLKTVLERTNVLSAEDSLRKLEEQLTADYDGDVQPSRKGKAAGDDDAFDENLFS